MPVFKGTTSGSVAGIAYNIPSRLTAYRLCNTNGGNITVTVSIVQLGVGNPVQIIGQTINSGECIGGTLDLIMPEGWGVYLAASSSCDYWFNVEPLNF